MGNIEDSRDWKNWHAPDDVLPEPTRPCEHWIARTRKAEAEVESLRQQLRGAVARAESVEALDRRSRQARAEAEAEVERLRKLAKQVLDALDAEKTPDYGIGHDRAVRAALAMLGKEPRSIEGETLTLDEIRERDDAR